MKTASIPLRVLVDVRLAVKALPSLYSFDSSLYSFDSIPMDRVDDFYKAIGAFSYYVDELVRQAGDVAVDAAA